MSFEDGTAPAFGESSALGRLCEISVDQRFELLADAVGHDRAVEFLLHALDVVGDHERATGEGVVRGDST